MLHVSVLHADVGFRLSIQQVDMGLPQRQLAAGQPRKVDELYLTTGYGFTGARQSSRATQTTGLVSPIASTCVTRTTANPPKKVHT